MKYVGCVIAVGCLLLAASGAQDDLVKKDLDRLQGVWQCTSYVVDGKDRTEKGMKLSFKGNKMSLLATSFPQEKDKWMTFKLDPSKKPKAIDLGTPDGTGKSKAALGIYSIEGDTLRLCWGEIGGDRPTSLKTKPGDKWTVHLYEKKKE